MLEDRDERLIVQSGVKPIRILELQPPGGKRMSAEQFMRGHAIKEGTTLGI